MATTAPAGMEWQSYFDGFNSVSDVLSGNKKPGITSQLLGHAINALAGESTDLGNKMGGNQPMFGAPAPQGSVPSPMSTPGMNTPMTPAPVVPFVAGQPQQFPTQINGQPMLTQPQFGTNIQQQPVTQTPSYSRFLFSPQ